MLVIAEVKAIEPARHAFHAMVKHVPDIGFALDEHIYRSMGRHFARELSFWGASEDLRMIMIATFGVTSAGVPGLSRLSLMPVTRQWLPVDTLDEQRLVRRLVGEGRAFKMILRYGRQHTARVPSLVLTDQGDTGVPLYP